MSHYPLRMHMLAHTCTHACKHMYYTDMQAHMHTHNEVTMERKMQQACVTKSN